MRHTSLEALVTTRLGTRVQRLWWPSVAFCKNFHVEYLANSFFDSLRHFGVIEFVFLSHELRHLDFLDFLEWPHAPFIIDRSICWFHIIIRDVLGLGHVHFLIPLVIIDDKEFCDRFPFIFLSLSLLVTWHIHFIRALLGTHFASTLYWWPEIYWLSYDIKD